MQVLQLLRLTCLAGGGGAGADFAAAPARPPADLASARGANCEGARPSATSSRLRYLMSDSSMSPCTVSVVCKLACRHGHTSSCSAGCGGHGVRTKQKLPRRVPKHACAQRVVGHLVCDLFSQSREPRQHCLALPCQLRHMVLHVHLQRLESLGECSAMRRFTPVHDCPQQSPSSCMFGEGSCRCSHLLHIGRVLDGDARQHLRQQVGAVFGSEQVIPQLERWLPCPQVVVWQACHIACKAHSPVRSALAGGHTTTAWHQHMTMRNAGMGRGRRKRRCT